MCRDKNVEMIVFRSSEENRKERICHHDHLLIDKWLVILEIRSIAHEVNEKITVNKKKERIFGLAALKAPIAS